MIPMYTVCVINGVSADTLAHQAEFCDCHLHSAQTHLAVMLDMLVGALTCADGETCDIWSWQTLDSRSSVSMRQLNGGIRVHF